MFEQIGAHKITHECVFIENYTVAKTWGKVTFKEWAKPKEPAI